MQNIIMSMCGAHTVFIGWILWNHILISIVFALAVAVARKKNHELSDWSMGLESAMHYNSIIPV